MMPWPSRVVQRAGPVTGWVVMALLAVSLGLLAESPPMPPGLGRMAPRVPAPAPDLRQLLFALRIGSPVWFAAAIAAPFLAVAARRVDPERRGWPVTMAVVLLILGGLAMGSTVFQHAVYYHGFDNRPGLASYLAVVAPTHLVPWAALAGAVAVVEGRRRVVAAMRDRDRMRAQVAEQRLLTLTAQLQPHFLFNTLQGISTLIHRDPIAADALLTRLSELLREMLRHRDRAVVSLGDEVRFAATYLSIVKTRFEDRLAFALEVPSSLHDREVPLFILQPLIENAVNHGIGGSLEGGRVTVRGSTRDDRLILEVEDDGAGLPTRGIIEGVGLSNTRERLRTTYGESGWFLEVKARPDQGAVTRVELPSRPYPPRAEG